MRKCRQGLEGKGSSIVGGQFWRFIGGRYGLGVTGGDGGNGGLQTV